MTVIDSTLDIHYNSHIYTYTYTHMPKLIVLAVVIALQGCAHRDYRDRAWDPQPGTQLFDQIPNWDQEALRVCGKTTQLC